MHAFPLSLTGSSCSPAYIMIHNAGRGKGAINRSKAAYSSGLYVMDGSPAALTSSAAPPCPVVVMHHTGPRTGDVSECYLHSNQPSARFQGGAESTSSNYTAYVSKSTTYIPTRYPPTGENPPTQSHVLTVGAAVPSWLRGEYRSRPAAATRAMARE